MSGAVDTETCSFESRLRSHLSESFVGDAFQLPSLLTDFDSDDDKEDDTDGECDVLSTCISDQRDIVERLRSSVLNPLCELVKSRTLAQLACCHRLQRTLDVQARSLALAERLNQAALRQEHQQGADFDKRRRSVGKLRQATRTMADQRFSTPSDKPGVESTRQLEEQLYSYQCSLEAAIRSLANISSTLLKHSATQGGDEDEMVVAGDFEALFAALPVKYRREGI